MNLKRTVCLLLLGIPILAWTMPYKGQKAWLLIAHVNEPDVSVANVRRMFRQDFRQPWGLQAKTIVGAKAADLRRVLGDPASAVVFWVGHGGRTIDSGALTARGVLEDADGVDVAPLFQQIHPNLRWVGVIGCHAQAIVERYRQAGFYRHNEALRIVSKDGQTIYPFGLFHNINAALKHLRASIKTHPGRRCIQHAPKGRSLVVSRLDGEGRSHAMVSLDGRSFGVILPSQERARLWVPRNLDLTLLEVVQLDHSADGYALEKFKIEADDGSAHWQRIPMGSARHVYRRSGQWSGTLVSHPGSCP